MILLAISTALGADAAGYLRIMTRPDFEGGDGKLGYWNLYGRLLNEGPYVALELRQAVLDRRPGSTEPWTDLHVKLEGGSVQGADTGNGGLANFRLSQVYAQAGNLGLAGTSWRVGTLDSNLGDLGLYDVRLGQVLEDTIGMQATVQSGAMDLVLGVGDAGYAIRGTSYNTVFSAGGTLRASVAGHFDAAMGGQVRHEPAVVGNRNAPYDTPGIAYEDWIRGRVVTSFLDEHPGQEQAFPDPVATSASSGKVVGSLGFGGFGPLRWNALYVNWVVLHPQGPTTETVDGVDYPVYVTSFTDQRSQLNVGNELQLQVVPGTWDLAWGILGGEYTDADNEVAPSDHDRTFYSTVLRNQFALSPVVHLLIESSAAREISRNGNRYRNHFDSLFENTAGAADSEGLEHGDSAERLTWQGKGGVVLNPLGPGIYARPSLRVLYGAQYSTQDNAFGNSFVETLADYNAFGNVERHWHHVLALEAEAWF